MTQAAGPSDLTLQGAFYSSFPALAVGSAKANSDGEFDGSDATPIICLSHLRWDFVWQRPQHLLSRFAQDRTLFFVEEPILDDRAEPAIEVASRADGYVILVRAYMGHHTSHQEREDYQAQMLTDLVEASRLDQFVLWYYTPMALAYSDHLDAEAVVFDVMDELSAFKFAPPRLLELEQELLERADVVFTGGLALYEAKAHRHTNIHCFPSSIEKEHFGQARLPQAGPLDQASIGHPRMGFFGVIDERFDVELLSAVAAARPDWHFVLIGPIVKIDPASIPALPNIHLLGGKNYQELPAYLAGWDVALLPFARNESTRYISPTKTPEYLAGGKPAVSTSILDVMRPYGELGLVHIADTPSEFEAAIEKALLQGQDSEWLARVDAFLEDISWDKTYRQMADHISQAAEARVSKMSDTLMQ